mgnify:CR=1 FL=1
MIRTKDIKEAETALNKLRQKAKNIEKSISESYEAHDDAESEFEYAILDAHITADEKRLERINEQIKEKEYDLKVLKGEAEPKRIAPWTKSRPSSETNIITFLEVA